MSPHPGMYRGDRRRKEDQRKAKQEAKGKTAPAVDGIDDWTLVSEPPAGGA